MNRTGLVAALLWLVAPGCMSDHGGGGGPVAPTNLAAAPLAGGAHLTWVDNSQDEDEFVIMRKTGAGSYEELTTVPFDTIQYHDAAVTAGMTYTYHVMAMNDGGSSQSNEVMFTAP